MWWMSLGLDSDDENNSDDIFEIVPIFWKPKFAAVVRNSFSFLSNPVQYSRVEDSFVYSI